MMNNKQLANVIENLDSTTDLETLREAVYELNRRCETHRRTILFQSRDLIPALRRQAKKRPLLHGFLECEKTGDKSQ